MSLQKLSRLDLLNEFESAPLSALFNQQTIAAVLSCSTQLLERNRWAGSGVPYLKIGGRVLYRKSKRRLGQRPNAYHNQFIGSTPNEGFHREIKLIQRRAYGFRNFENYRTRVKVLCG